MDAEQRARFARQLLLPEIGQEGQTRIIAATAAVGGTTLAHAVAQRYCERAGFAAIEAGDIVAETNLGDPAARDVLAGSRQAVREILRCCQWTPPGPKAT